MRIVLAVFVASSLAGCASVQLNTQGEAATTLAPFDAQLGLNRVSVPSGSQLSAASIDGHPAFCTKEAAWFALGDARGVCFTDAAESEVRDGGEHRPSRFGLCLEAADDAAFIARIPDPSHAAVCQHGDAALLVKRHLHFGGQACRYWQSCAEPLHQAFDLPGVVDCRHAAKATAGLFGSRQFHAWTAR
jgi:hypothetical protein